VIRYILIVRCAMEKSTLVINKITYNLTDSLPFYAIILLIFILFVCLIQRRFATLIRSYSDWSHLTSVFKSPIQLLVTLATDYTTLNTLITCVSNMEVMMVWRRPEGAVTLQRMIERMSSVWTFRKKNTYTHNFWVFKTELSTTVSHCSMYHRIRCVYKRMSNVCITYASVWVTYA